MVDDFSINLLAFEVFLGFGFQVLWMGRVVTNERRLLVVLAIRVLEFDDGGPVRIARIAVRVRLRHHGWRRHRGH